MTDEEKKPDTESTPKLESEPPKAKPKPKPKPKRKAAARKEPAQAESAAKAASTPPPAAQTPVATAPPPAEKKGSSALAIFALLLVFVLAGAGFFGYQQLQQQIHGLAQNAEQSGQSNQTQVAQIADVNDQVSGLENQLNGLAGQLATFETATDEQLKLLAAQTTKSKRQWLIVEAEYLASVANVRLQLAGDLATSVAALRAADQRLKENGSPALFPIRQQIATEIAALQSTAMPDVVGVSSRILALENSVSLLEVSDPHTGVSKAPSMGVDGPQPVPEDWEKALKSAWDNLSKLVVVRRNDQPIAAMMTPEQVGSIQKNLALKLETARLALIHQDAELYVSSLEMVEKWLNDYFDGSQTQVSAALQEVQDLKGQLVKAELPDISGSLTALRELPLLQQTVDLPQAQPAAPAEEAPAEEAPAEEAPAEEAPAEEAPAEEAPAEEAPAEEAPAQPTETQ